MSDTENSNPSEDGAGGAPKRSFKKIIIILVVLILIGGGGYYYWRTKSAAADETAETSEDESSSTEKKSKSKKSSDDSEETAEDEKKPSKKSSKSDAPSDEDVKHVIELPPFIVNLADSENARYLRMTVSLGIGGEEGDGGESEKPDQVFMTRVRNAMLAVLVEKSSDEILTVEGKAKLRKELLKAAKSASEEPEVKAIYITDFIVQL
jgi:flagellar protein FliL